MIDINPFANKETLPFEMHRKPKLPSIRIQMFCQVTINPPKTPNAEMCCGK